MTSSLTLQQQFRRGQTRPRVLVCTVCHWLSQPYQHTAADLQNLLSKPATHRCGILCLALGIQELQQCKRYRHEQDRSYSTLKAHLNVSADPASKHQLTQHKKARQKALVQGSCSRRKADQPPTCKTEAGRLATRARERSARLWTLTHA